MPTATPAQLYKKAAAFSATPGQLVLMLYDGALRFTRQALEALDIEDFARSQETLNNNVIRAQAILTELQATLNFEKAEELSTLLFRLYDYMHSELSKANLERSKEPLQNVLRFLGDIRDAWAQMLAQLGESAPPDRG